MATTRLSRAETRQRTRADVLAAAERLFVQRGFHSTSLDQVAGEAGYTKGAVYSNFASKEELFLAVYEQRSAQGVAKLERTIARGGGGADGLDAAARAVGSRRGFDDGWLAVFFEFWAHAIRRPELRERFAAIHRRALEPVQRAVEDHLRDAGATAPSDVRSLVIAINAMQLGLSLERLTFPDLVDAGLGQRMGRLFLDDLAERGVT